MSTAAMAFVLGTGVIVGFSLLNQPSAPSIQITMPLKEFTQPAALSVSTNATLQPGIYRSQPYTCLIIVPEEHPDAEMVRSPATADSRMPIIRPEMHLVPEAKAKQADK